MRKNASNVRHGAAAKTLAVLKWLWLALQQSQRRRTDRALLANMNDHLLVDIGLGPVREEKPAQLYQHEGLTKHSQPIACQPADPL